MQSSSMCPSVCVCARVEVGAYVWLVRMPYEHAVFYRRAVGLKTAGHRRYDDCSLDTPLTKSIARETPKCWPIIGQLQQ